MKGFFFFIKRRPVFVLVSQKFSSQVLISSDERNSSSQVHLLKVFILVLVIMWYSRGWSFGRRGSV
jgi:hypothetical protein